VVSEVSITLDGITTTTITYSDGSAEVIRTAAGLDGGGKNAPTYNAQGTINSPASSATTSTGATASSQGATA